MAEYRAIHTTRGLQLLAQAQGLATQINLTHMAVGDGNGDAVVLDPAQAGLVNEVFRASLSRTYRPRDDIDTLFAFELIVPVEAGAFTARELGIFTDTGELFAIANIPATYKSVAADGISGETILRVFLAVDSADTITIIADPNTATATQSWVLANVNLALMLPGGLTGDVLRKASDADGDTEWVSLAQIVTEVNDPDAMLRANNLSDVTDVPTARTNLDIYSKAEVIALLGLQREAIGVTAGTVAHTASPNVPLGYLACNGAAYSRTQFANLFAAIGTRYGAGDGVNTFNVPDERGLFRRSLDLGRGFDAGRDLGQMQWHQVGEHNHEVANHVGIDGARLGLQRQDPVRATADPTKSSPRTGMTGGNETRPVNIAFLAIIKI